MTKSLVPASKRKSNPHVQVASLARVAKRALSHAEWMEELIKLDPEEFDVPRVHEDIEKSMTKAHAAIDEMVTIAEESGDSDLIRTARRARAMGWR